MGTGLFFSVRRGQYFIGLRFTNVASLTSAIGSTVLNGDEIMDGNGQGRFAVVTAGALVLTPS